MRVTLFIGLMILLRASPLFEITDACAFTEFYNGLLLLNADFLILCGVTVANTITGRFWRSWFLMRFASVFVVGIHVAFTPNFPM